MHIALPWVITHPMGQIASKTVHMGLSFGSKQSLFGWLGHLPAVARPHQNSFFFSNEKFDFKKSPGTSRVHQEAQIRSQKQIPLEFGLRVADLVYGRFF